MFAAEVQPSNSADWSILALGRREARQCPEMKCKQQVIAANCANCVCGFQPLGLCGRSLLDSLAGGEGKERKKKKKKDIKWFPELG